MPISTAFMQTFHSLSIHPPTPLLRLRTRKHSTETSVFCSMYNLACFPLIWPLPLLWGASIVLSLILERDERMFRKLYIWDWEWRDCWSDPCCSAALWYFYLWEYSYIPDCQCFTFSSAQCSHQFSHVQFQPLDRPPSITQLWNAGRVKACTCFIQDIWRAATSFETNWTAQSTLRRQSVLLCLLCWLRDEREGVVPPKHGVKPIMLPFQSPMAVASLENELKVSKWLSV